MIPLDVALILIGITAGVLVTYTFNGFPVIKRTIMEFIEECRRGRNSK